MALTSPLGSWRVMWRKAKQSDPGAVLGQFDMIEAEESSLAQDRQNHMCQAQSCDIMFECPEHYIGCYLELSVSCSGASRAAPPTTIGRICAEP